MKAYAVINVATRSVKEITLNERVALELCEVLTKPNDLYIVATKEIADMDAFDALKKLVAGNATMGKVRGE